MRFRLRNIILAGMFLALSGGISSSTDYAKAADQTKTDKQEAEGLPARAIEAGPLKDMREKLWGQISEAKKRGVGVANYMTAFDSMEEEVKAGADEAKVKQKLMSIAHSLHGQMRSSIQLKQQALYTQVTAKDAGSPGGGGGGTMAEGQMESMLFGLMNRDRAANKLSALSRNGQLDSVAKGHSQDMVKNNYIDHVNKQGLDPKGRALKAGKWNSIAENVGYVHPKGSSSAQIESAEQMFMNSPHHRANLLNPLFKQGAVGITIDSTGAIKITQMFSAD